MLSLFKSSHVCPNLLSKSIYQAHSFSQQVSESMLFQLKVFDCVRLKEINTIFGIQSQLENTKLSYLRYLKNSSENCPIKFKKSLLWTSFTIYITLLQVAILHSKRQRVRSSSKDLIYSSVEKLLWTPNYTIIRPCDWLLFVN